MQLFASYSAQKYQRGVADTYIGAEGQWLAVSTNVEKIFKGLY